jgi:hypothetical protein
MGNPVQIIEDIVSPVVETVGNVVSEVVDTASHIVEQAGKEVTKAVDAAIADPIGTIAKIAAVATGNAELLPYITAGDVVAHGGSIEQAIVAGATTAAVQGIVSNVTAPAEYTGPVYDYGEPPATVEVGAPIPPPTIEAQPLPPMEPAPEAPVVARDVVPAPVAPPVQDMGEITVTAPRPEVPAVDTTDPTNPANAVNVVNPVNPPTPVDPNAPDNIDVGGGFNPAEVPVSDAVPSYVNPNPTPDMSLPDALVDTAKAIGGNMSADDLAKLAAGWVLINGVLTPPAAAKGHAYGPIDPTTWGTVGQVNPTALNPGFMVTPPRFYNNPSPVASQYYWGQHPYQSGAAFDPALYNAVPSAPVTPFGLQQMYNPETQTIPNLLQGVGQASAVAPYNLPQAPRV